MIRKAVIPAAGRGTRLYPLTKSLPKVMLPVAGKPVIQYVVEEAVASGIREIIIVVGAGGDVIKKHFAQHSELKVEFQFVVQSEPRGLGDAVFVARELVGAEPFAVMLGDAILESDRPVTGQLMEVAERRGGSVVALEEIAPDKVERYGVIDGEPVEENVVRIRGIVEKPARDAAPSNLAVAGRYVFTPHIFDCLARTGRGLNNEVQITDAMKLLLQEEPLHGLRFRGTRWDIGDKLDYDKTRAAFEIKRFG